MTFKEQIIFSEAVHDSILDNLKMTGKPIILFGAGIVGYYTVSILKRVGISIVGFCDDDEGKQKQPYLGYPVFSFEEMCRQYPGACVLLTVANTGRIVEKIERTGLNFEVLFYGTVDICDDFPTDESFVKNHIDEYEEAYHSLDDEFSKSVFVNILNYKLTRDVRYTHSIKSWNMYFEPDILPLGENEVFVDVGAFNGDTVQEFIQHLSEYAPGVPYKRILALEPDPDNFQKLVLRVRKNGWSAVDCYPCGAWNRKETLSFSSGLDCGSTAIDSQNNNIADRTQINVDTLDHLLGDERATFIKMDIEGAESKALEGGSRVIARDKPKLAISVYHKKEDFFSILLYLKKIVPDYRFQLRHYTDTAADTVLYCSIKAN